MTDRLSRIDKPSKSLALSSGIARPQAATDDSKDLLPVKPKGLRSRRPLYGPT